MGTEVLRPQDCLNRPTPTLFPHRKPHPRPFSKPAPKRREGSPKPAKTAGGEAKKKGGSVEGFAAVAGRLDPAVFGTGRLGPDPDMIPKELRLRLADMYARAGFAISPSPTSLPLPSFSRRSLSSPSIVTVDDSATRDLRRLLRLE
ncbi:uncharacterized protein [Elaeis guineensis]|uniref:Uncharacterized protein LOC105038104 n=1 Tax=Elaeis guineensis var. tenera TaxID=51953 RepID=A0A6I9QNA6_ELAGV|nr:uncharacterized protein LOC105038104 [Elaeis guineensis]